MENNSSHRVKVLVVEDSLVMQRLYRKLLEHDDRFELLGIATNGQQAIDFVASFKPDVVSMDINMPLMDGVEATRQIMQLHPVPIVIVTSLYHPQEQELAMRVLEAGAVSIMAKPYGPGHPKFESSIRTYLSRLWYMSEIKVIRRKSTKPIISSKAVVNSEKPKQTTRKYVKPSVIVIGASAGGPEGVKTILANISPDIDVPILIVQHIDPGFAEGYVHWLQSQSKIPVRLAAHNTTMEAGVAYLPPGNHHLLLQNKQTLTISADAPVKGHRPAVSVLFTSAAAIFKEKTMAIILSGMGSDGAQEIKHLSDLGAFTLAQDEASCLVFGMPGVAIQLGGIKKVLPPLEIVSEINHLLSQNASI